MQNKGIIIGLFIVIGALSLKFIWPDKNSEFDLPKKVDFNFHIRPILSQNCYVCHGNDPDSREGGLRLDTEEGAKALLENGGYAIVNGNLKESLLIDRVSHPDPELRMPPPEAKKILSAREIALLEQWIDEGAEWKPHWAFVPPSWPKLPRAIEKTSIANQIDHLIELMYSEQDLIRVAKALKNSLIRRVAFILTGLPPTDAEVTQFLNDPAVNAYEKMVDRFLGSSAYGEHWARHWMDLVRYGESMGHEGDFNISHPWEYRDYLIRAFNEDVPYDQLVMEHLAGDLLSNPRINQKEGFQESHLGTSYFFLGEGKHGPVDIKLEEADKIDNMIDVTSKTFQALTVACARCHDHKFDPIPTADYYSMYGMIESSRLLPKPARKPYAQKEKLEQATSLKIEMRDQIADYLNTKGVLSEKQSTTNNINLEVPLMDTAFAVLADFRNGHWEGWYTEGIAFGNHPAKAELVIDEKLPKVKGILSGFATSRSMGKGLHGVLHSPNFTIEDDFISVRAAGMKGTIRVIIDNFQVIQGPLWDELEAKIDDPDWKTYQLYVGLAKGHKAYLEFMPGQFNKHIFSIDRNAYIDIKYAVSHQDKLDENKSFFKDPKDGQLATREVINRWRNNEELITDGPVIANLIGKIPPRFVSNQLAVAIKEFQSISADLYDSTHFIGMADADPIYSPIFQRGSVHNLSDEKIAHRFFSAVEAGPDTFSQQGSGRLEWALSVVDTKNPLTSRVIVNRIWHHIFGRGIVETVDNFGLQGQLPTNPALLDYLAIQFVTDGWSIKRLIKEIILTETFQQTTVVKTANQKIDPNNLYLHHFPVRRLEAESIRDAILSVAGCLDERMYGPGVPVNLTSFMTGRGRPRASGPLDGEGRRSIYTAVRRNFIPPFMLAFDLPVPFSTFGKRNTTNVPAQSLTLLNDPFVHEQAQFWADNLVKNHALTVDEKIQSIYLKAFSRQPLPAEVEQAKEFLEILANELSDSVTSLQNDPSLWKDFCHSVINLKEFIHLL